MQEHDPVEHREQPRAPAEGRGGRPGKLWQQTVQRGPDHSEAGAEQDGAEREGGGDQQRAEQVPTQVIRLGKTIP